MSVRHFNYTHRKRLLHSDTSIALSRREDEVSFDVQLRLASYDFPGDARLVVEAYRQTSLKRFGFGTVSNPRPMGSTLLDGFPDVESLLFRVKVIDLPSGKLLAEADRIKPADPDGGERPSFLRVRSDHLSGEAWKLEFEDDYPILVIEKSYGPYQSLLASPHFRWLVLPQLLRSLLERALREDLDDVVEESATSWQSAVLRQARLLTGTTPPDEGDEQVIAEWITSAVRAFSRRHGLAQRYHADVFGGSEE